MRLRSLAVLLLAPSLCMLGCEESADVTEGATPTEGVEGAAEGATPTAGAEGAAAEGAGEGTEAAAEGAAADVPGPDAVCSKIVDAVKAGDAAAMAAESTSATAEMMSAEETKAGMMAALKDATCGDATIAEDGATATVAVTAGDQARDVPFKKVEDTWKFDGEAYVAKYPPPAKEEPKGKKKKKKKKKRKKKKKKGG